MQWAKYGWVIRGRRDCSGDLVQINVEIVVLYSQNEKRHSDTWHTTLCLSHDASSRSPPRDACDKLSLQVWDPCVPLCLWPPLRTPPAVLEADVLHQGCSKSKMSKRQCKTDMSGASAKEMQKLYPRTTMQCSSSSKKIVERYGKTAHCKHNELQKQFQTVRPQKSLTEVQNPRKGRARLCKAGIRKGEMESLAAKQARRDLRRWQTACSGEGKAFKICNILICHDVSRYVSMQLQDPFPTYQYAIGMSVEYRKMKQFSTLQAWLICKDLWCSLDLDCSWTVVEYGKPGRSKAPV